MLRLHHIFRPPFFFLVSSLCKLRQKRSLIINGQEQKNELPLMGPAHLAIPHQTPELLNQELCSSGFICQRSAVFSLQDDSQDHSFLQQNLF